MTNIGVLVPAAGASHRMRGRDKLMEIIDGIPQIRRITLAACAVSDHVVITVPCAKHARAQSLKGLDVTILPIPGREEGMSASLRRGISTFAPDISGVIIVPADMPEIDADCLKRFESAVHQGEGKHLLRGATRDGRVGHPVYFPKKFFKEISQIKGDFGARAILADNPAQAVILPDTAAILDLDTPEEWEEWRRARKARRL